MPIEGRSLARRFLAGLTTAAVAPLAAGCGAGGGSYPEQVWGIHGTKPGWLHKPRVAAFDAEDQLYIADLTDRIQVFDRDGNFLRHWRTPDLNVDGPSGLTVDRHGRVLVADTHFYRVLVYDRVRRAACSRSATASRGRPRAGSATRPTS